MAKKKISPSAVPLSVDVARILAVIGDDPKSPEISLLIASDRAAHAHFETRRGVMMTDDSDHYETFKHLAFTVFEKGPQDGLVALKAWDESATDVDLKAIMDFPSDAAHGLYAPQISAAYYFGLALGMRLAGGAR